MLFQLACELNEDLLGRDGVAQLLDDLLNLVIELRLGSYGVETLDQLLHDFEGVIRVFVGHHAYQEHDAFHKARVVEVQVDYQVLKDLLVLVDEVWKSFEELNIPLNDRLLLFTI